MHRLYREADWEYWWGIFCEVCAIEVTHVRALFWSRQETYLVVEYVSDVDISWQKARIAIRKLPPCLQNRLQEMEASIIDFSEEIWQFFHYQNQHSQLLYLPVVKQNECVGGLYIFAPKTLMGEIQRIVRQERETVQKSLSNLFYIKALEEKIKILEKQNEALEVSQQSMYENAVKFLKIHKQLTDSLQYAQRMQKAILPPNALFTQSFEEHFILYQPKDIVSGDFYWFSQLAYTFLAVVDCTGHGVPGAFMSMIGNTLLNEIINVKRQSNPAFILSFLHTGIRNALNQEESKNHDGMDMGLCRLERDENFDLKLTYAGAKNTMLVYQKATQSFQKIMGNRTHIGGNDKAQLQFDNVEFLLKDGDILYMMTDGIIDACDTRRKPFGMTRLVEFLTNYIHTPLLTQGTILKETLESYQSQTHQRDDITVLGIKP